MICTPSNPTTYGAVRATSAKLAAAHAAKPPSRSVALTRPSLCKVAAAKLD